MILKHAIVGAGFGLDVHYPCFKENKNFDVVALCNSGSQNRIDNRKIPVFSDWRKMLHDKEIQSLSIATPPSFHKEIFNMAASKGINIYCEKPFGLNYNDAIDMKNTAIKNRIICTIGFQYRYQSGISEIRDILSNKKIGDIKSIDIKWLTSGRSDSEKPWSWQHSSNLGGGVINAFLPHIIDIIPWLTNLKFKEFLSKSKICINERPFLDSTKEVTAEDHVFLEILLSQDVKSTIEISNTCKESKGLNINIVGTEGKLNFSHVWPFKDSDVSLEVEVRNSRTKILSNSSNKDSLRLSMGLLIKDYFDLITTKNNIESSLPLIEDGVECRRILDKIKTFTNTDKLISL